MTAMATETTDSQALADEVNRARHVDRELAKRLDHVPPGEHTASAHDSNARPMRCVTS
jgi:hypothetical protein